jgi:hypothetical protein
MSIDALMADDATTAAPRVHISPSDGSNGKLHGLKRRRLVQRLPETRAVIDNLFSIQQHLLMPSHSAHPARAESVWARATG